MLSARLRALSGGDSLVVVWVGQLGGEDLKLVLCVDGIVVVVGERRELRRLGDDLALAADRLVLLDFEDINLRSSAPLVDSRSRVVFARTCARATS